MSYRISIRRSKAPNKHLLSEQRPRRAPASQTLAGKVLYTINALFAIWPGKNHPYGAGVAIAQLHLWQAQAFGLCWSAVLASPVFGACQPNPLVQNRAHEWR